MEVEATPISQLIQNHKRAISDWPKAGVNFIDILSMLAEHSGDLRAIVSVFEERCLSLQPDGIIAIDARGFIFAAPLAYALNLPLLVVRKKGKLPPPTTAVDYSLEYGTATLEIAPATLKGKKNLVLVDDILATGGTAKAVIELCSQYEVQILEAMFVGEVAALAGRAALGEVPAFACAQF